MSRSRIAVADMTHLVRHRFDAAMAHGRTYAGVDEVGRGCLAGPVVAAAVIPPLDIKDWSFVNDSKSLNETRRQALADLVMKTAISVGIGASTSDEIDRMNILEATKLAMRRAVGKLQVAPNVILVDGNHTMGLRIATLPVVSGDARSLSIAAASIVAKVHRDEYMKQLDAHYPQYGFVKHVGYGTKDHIAALDEHGPMTEHRFSFAPVRRASQLKLETQSYG